MRACGRILDDEHVYEAEIGAGEKKKKRQNEKGARIVRKNMMRSGSRIITDRGSRNGRGKHKRRIINEAAGPQ